MGYIYYCVECKKFFVAEFSDRNPFYFVKCEYCEGLSTVYCDLTKEEYDRLSDEKKQAFKYGIRAKYKTVNDLREVYEKQRIQQEKQRIQEEENVRNMVRNIMLNTGYNFEGYNIVNYCGIVSAESVLGTGMFSEFSLAVNDFLGTTSDTYQNKLANAKQDALEKLKLIAASINANAIIGIDFDVLTLSNNALVVSANGTAVKIVKNN